MKILIAGKGFIGRSLGERLEENHEVKYLDIRNAEYERDITKDFSIEEGFDLVFHTIGLPPGFASAVKYENVHVEGTRNILKGVDFGRIIYVSALGAGDVEHSFHRTKKKAEELIEDEANDYTILRPSVVYHRDNKLLKMIRRMAFTRIFPDIKTEVQPIRRSDLVQILVNVTDLSFSGQNLTLAGPEVHTFGELGARIYNEEGYGCFKLPYPQFLLEWKLIGLSFLPPPFQRENIELLRNDNVAEQNDASGIVELETCFPDI